MIKLLPGGPYPLGATWDGAGVNFAVYSQHATELELCLFDGNGVETRLPLVNRTAFIWHAYAPGLAPGQRYAFRAHGPYEPEKGLRFNSHVVLLDPYAKAVDGVQRWDEGCFAYPLDGEHDDLTPTEAEQLGAPRAVVIDPQFDWEGDVPLRTPMARTVIYEAHVRGLTMRHPDVPEAIRGTYAAIAHPAIVRYLVELGVTAIELMPVHTFIDDKLLLDRGLRNYWGYNSIGFFAPDVRYRASDGALGSEVREFKSMVKALHRAGLEVILDVVYNHTAEGNHQGPTFNLKGLDNPTYYRLVESSPRHYFDVTGTGNTLNVGHPQVLMLIMDSLRYWAEEMHVDGFRFDLASALARQISDVDPLSSFFTLIHQSPQLNHVKLIAEPWDVGDGGYQVGNFPVRWSEWNGRYRDNVRAFWRGDDGAIAELGYRLTGSSDLYEGNGRNPSASINLITAHDGATLRDLVSYEHKHNEANGEGNRDGSDNEHASNCGAEGPTDDPLINAVRARQQRNLLATLLLSQGTPMLVGGDELGRTQQGNNNAYCQDNELSWVDWAGADQKLLKFVQRVLRIRREHPALRRSTFFRGLTTTGSNLKDLLWFRWDGAPMDSGDWQNGVTRTLSMFLSGRAIGDVDESGRAQVDDHLLLLINGSDGDLTFHLPQQSIIADGWQLLVDTNDDDASELRRPGESTTMVARSLKLYRAPSRALRAGGSLHELNATYRLQLQPGFGFAEATAAVPYLSELGVTDLYVSPVMAAATGSTHGYDVVDHSRLNPELGTREQLEALAAAVADKKMGMIVDWVPNHMGIVPTQNRWWSDVLKHGPASRYAEYFDIDWNPPRADLKNRVLLPILGARYGQVLERGELKVELRDGKLVLSYFEHLLPLDPRSLAEVLIHTAQRSSEVGGDEIDELTSIAAAMRHLPVSTVETHETARERHRLERERETAVIERRLAELLTRSPALSTALAGTLSDLNGRVGDGVSFGALDTLLQEQNYRLAFWQVASEEINYRRFFDINALAALRMESDQVFAAAHTLLFELLDKRVFQGLRLDHVDGLYDPRAYCERLQSRFMALRGSDPSISPDDLARPLPILVEKILGPREQLAASWPVDGTTGYEFGADVIRLWVAPDAEASLTATYVEETGDTRTFNEHVREAKRHIQRFSLASEMTILAQTLERIAIRQRHSRDFTLASLATALTETISAFSVYRSYLREGDPASEEDERNITAAVRAAMRRNPTVSRSVFKFIEDVLLLRPSIDARAAYVQFALRVQQLTGPVTAKAVEDTAFYRYPRLLALNEVGGTPEQLGGSVDDFHAHQKERLLRWPLSMTTVATHDSKRGEDANARIAVLSECAEEWSLRVAKWSKLGEGAKSAFEGELWPTRKDEYLFYQALVGAWPAGAAQLEGAELAHLTERMALFMEKATKEAKEVTSWITPKSAYDEAVRNFVGRMLSHAEFLRDFGDFCGALSVAGAVNGLAQTVLRICVPGVPDTYQGAELWNQRLVDPDNRQRVDFAARQARLTGVGEIGVNELRERYGNGDIKLFVLHRLLEERRAHRALFLRGDYVPLTTSDTHAVAFARTLPSGQPEGEAPDEQLICCVARFPYRLTGNQWPLGAAWGERSIALPERLRGRYRNLLTGQTVEANEAELRLSGLFAELPVAVLRKEAGE